MLKNDNIIQDYFPNKNSVIFSFGKSDTINENSIHAANEQFPIIKTYDILDGDLSLNNNNSIIKSNDISNDSKEIPEFNEQNLKITNDPHKINTKINNNDNDNILNDLNQTDEDIKDVKELHNAVNKLLNEF